MVVVPRYSHHRHTGRLRPHHETSYALLVFIMMLSGLVLAGLSTAVSADVVDSGTFKVEGVVGGPRPTTGAVITNPVTGQSFQTNPITVEGTCPDRTMVKIFKNGVLGGTTLCQSNRRFSLQMDLVIGKNDLTALAFNNLEEAGPDSPVVTVTLNAPSGGPGFSTELLLQSQNFYRGSRPGETVTWPIEIVGGVAPYAVSFDWGDKTSDLVTRPTAGPFTLKHVYKQPGGYLGSYPLIIRATDVAGHSAYLQLTTIVNEAKGEASAGNLLQLPFKLNFNLVWPIFGVVVLVVLAFWLGERREKKILMGRLEAST